MDIVLLATLLEKPVTTLRGLLQPDLTQSIFWVSPLLSALQEEGIEVDLLQNVANPGILMAIEIQTKGAQLNYVVWTVTQSFPPKGAQQVIGGTPWLGTWIETLLPSDWLVQLCNNVYSQWSMMFWWGTVPIVFLHPSSIDVFVHCWNFVFWRSVVYLVSKYSDLLILAWIWSICSGIALKKKIRGLLVSKCAFPNRHENQANRT